MADDWETEPDFVNDVSEKEQRWGSKTVPGSGRQEYIDMHTLREEVKQADQQNKLKTAPKPSYGYGGKFGVERDRMDKSAVGHDYIETSVKHSSQKDHSVGFGGKFGVQSDRQDKSAVGWDHHEQTVAHPSQTDYTKGFGGKYGVQTERMDTVGVSNDKSSKPHSSQLRPDIQGQTGGIASIRSRFESKGVANAPTPDGPTPAQRRIAEERARWERERDNASVRAPSLVQAPVSQPTVVPAPQPVPEFIEDVSPPAESEPMSEPTEPAPTDYQQEVADLPMYSVVALYDYTAEADDELTFSVGELITEVEKIDPGWWKGVCRGKVGLFPSNYVQEQ